jgi:hypothetical protein
MSHTYEGSPAHDTGLFGSGWHSTPTEPRPYPSVDDKYSDKARECPVCGCYRREDCREACG